MNLAVLNLVVSSATLTGVLAIGMWIGAVNQKLRDHARRLWDLERPINATNRSSIQND